MEAGLGQRSEDTAVHKRGQEFAERRRRDSSRTPITARKITSIVIVRIRGHSANGSPSGQRSTSVAVICSNSRT